MIFNSVVFALFLSVVLLVDLALRHRGPLRKPFLLAASYLFYGWWDWRFLALIGYSTVVDWFVAKAIVRSADLRRRRWWLLLSLAGNLGLLGVFKYLDFFLASTERLLRGLGLEADVPLLELVLPVGISFYTFQTLSYTIDVYRGRMRPARSFVDFALFVAFFPQLVAGPIVRAREFLPQLERPIRPTPVGVSAGLYALLAGLFKKVVIADTLGAALVDPFYADPAEHGTIGTLLVLYGYAFQVYGDFAGYSQIAIGCGRLLGFRLPENFRAPYSARTVIDLLRRWHVTLATWLRDYLYVSLGGNRGGKLRAGRNVMLTMLLGGLWHGADWTFAIWGALLGVALILSRLREQRLRAAGRRLSDHPARVLGQRLFVFSAWCVIGVLFRAGDLAQAGAAYAALLRFGQVGVLPDWWITAMVLGLVAFHFGNERLARPLERGFVRAAPELRGALAVVLLGLLAALEVGQNPFIYFQF